MKPQITFEKDRLNLLFDDFGPESYKVFLKAKAIPETTVEFLEDGEHYRLSAPSRFAPMLGLPVPRPPYADLPLHPLLLEDQRVIVPMFLDCKRFACWSGCGNGKTFIGLEGGRHAMHRTQRPTLCITMNEIVNEWFKDCEKFYGSDLKLHRINSRQELRDWCKSAGPEFGITNYEKMNPEDLDHQVVSEMKALGCIILDESNRLACGGGKQKWAIIKSCKGIEYKLSLTATPAPNDPMEFASQASFLEKMRTDAEIIWTFFTRDNKTHRWTVRPHARKAFYEFMSGWSIYVHNPKRYGWRLDLPDVPAPIVKVHEIEMTSDQRLFLSHFAVDKTGQMQIVSNDLTNTIQRNKMAQAAKGFLYNKTEAQMKKELQKAERRVVSLQAQMDQMDASGEAKGPVYYGLQAELDQWQKAVTDLLGGDKWAQLVADAQEQEEDADDKPKAKKKPAKGKAKLKGTRALPVALTTGRATRIASNKPAFIANLIRDEIQSGLQVLVWTVFDEESDILAELLDEQKLFVKYEMLTGKTKKQDRVEILKRFQSGETSCLISRSSLLGFGLNFQCCGSMIFSGWNDSFVAYWQAVRRAVRFGQTKSVRVHIPCVRDLEEDQLDNIFRKEEKHLEAIAEMETNYIRAKESAAKILEKANS